MTTPEGFDPVPITREWRLRHRTFTVQQGRKNGKGDWYAIYFPEAEIRALGRWILPLYNKELDTVLFLPSNESTPGSFRISSAHTMPATNLFRLRGAPVPAGRYAAHEEHGGVVVDFKEKVA